MKARIKGFDDPFRKVETVTMKGVNGTYFAEDVEFEQEPQGESALEAVNEERIDNLISNWKFGKFGKPTNKVEPKFKLDDFIVYKDNIWKVCNIALQSYYELLKINNEVSTISIEDVDENAHLWTIKDAKEGDVLSYVTDEGDSWIMIYWSLYEPYEGHVHYHALLVNDNFTDKGTCCICIDDLKPASKEQRDTLFQKMGEAGYEWDAEQKELKKIEDEPENYKKQLMSEMADLVIDYIQQKPTWKPTEKQIDAIRLARSFVTDDFSDNPTLSETLLELEKQLKKIMEE